MSKNRLALGIKDRAASIEKLDQVLCTLFLVLANNLAIFWAVGGGSGGNFYRSKLDMTWSHIKRLGMRMSFLGHSPSLDPDRQREKAWPLPRAGAADVRGQMEDDLKAEAAICAGVRGNILALQEGGDWSSMSLLAEILAQREDAFFQLETILEDPVLEHIWEDEDMSMENQKEKAHNPLH